MKKPFLCYIKAIKINWVFFKVVSGMANMETTTLIFFMQCEFVSCILFLHFPESFENLICMTVQNISSLPLYFLKGLACFHVFIRSYNLART